MPGDIGSHPCRPGRHGYYGRTSSHRHSYGHRHVYTCPYPNARSHGPTYAYPHTAAHGPGLARYRRRPRPHPL